MRYVLAAGMLAAAALTAGAAPAGATNECRGLQVCVRVAGPWVVVPTSTRTPRPTVSFQLSCPRGYVVGGLDAELSERGIDLAFLGKLGAPVNPGISTSRSVLFVARWVRGRTGRPSFRPHIGCIRQAGGGRRIPTAVRAVPPGEPTIRRAKTIRVWPWIRTAAVRCARDERLVDAWHALGFYGAKPPEQRLLGSVRARRSVVRGRVVASIRATIDTRSVRAVVQVGAVCAGGR